MKQRTGEPWMPAPDYGHSLKGMTLNLLVRDIDRSIAFQTRILQAEVVYSDPDIAVLRGFGTEWMLHADHTYLENNLYDLISNVSVRGTGIEIRLHDCDPDEAEKRALDLGYAVLAETENKPHGLRECYLVDDDGYIWVPDVPC